MITTIFTLYTVVGLLFAVYFVLSGMKRLDANTRGTSIWFKLLIFPASVALWPFLLAKTAFS